jgi:Cu+-exporting ATPase
LAGSYAMARTFTDDAGHTVYLVVDGKLAATVDLADERRPGAAEMIGWLKKEGIDTVLLSGDTEEKCKTMADALGIDHVYSEQLPQQKTAIVETLKKSGTVVMVGDGINDAPSLASADSGVSFGHATGIAVNSAQVILMDDQGLDILVTALKMSRATVRTIKQNLFWAFFYNVMAIPLAAAGYLSPLIASLSMAFSDVIVIGNSVRLKFKRL